MHHLSSTPDSATNSSIESYSESEDRAVIFAYRPESDDNSLTIMPRGLRAGGTYQVSMQDSTKTWTATGAELMVTGFKVTLAAQDTAEIIYIDTIQPLPGIRPIATP